MNILLTGACKYSDAFLKRITELFGGYDFIQYEKDKVDNPEKYDIAICNGLFLYNDIKDFKNLKYIQLTSAGLDRVPLEYIKNNNIKIFNARGVYSVPMAEYAICGVLDFYKKSACLRENQKNHSWIKNRDVFELCGKNVCIIGCGSVGIECAKRFCAFNARVTGIDINIFEHDFFEKIHPIGELKKCVGVADIIVLTLPLTEKTKHIINKDVFDKMKNGALLVNISRGAVVNEADLLNALKNNLGGAILDVFEEEPLCEGSPLWDLDNVILSPHNSFVGENNGKRLEKLIIDNLEGFMK